MLGSGPIFSRFYIIVKDFVDMCGVDSFIMCVNNLEIGLEADCPVSRRNCQYDTLICYIYSSLFLLYRIRPGNFTGDKIYLGAKYGPGKAMWRFYYFFHFAYITLRAVIISQLAATFRLQM